MRIEHGCFLAGRDHRVGNPQLTVEFERARMNHHCPRGRARTSRLIDDAAVYAKALEPERQDQAGRAGADYEDLLLHLKHRSLIKRSSI